MNSSIAKCWLAAAAVGTMASYAYAYAGLRVDLQPPGVQFLSLVVMDLILTLVAYWVLRPSREGVPWRRVTTTICMLGMLALALYLVYRPVTATEYGSPDDYSLAWSVMQGKSLRIAYLRSGRPLAQLIVAPLFAAFGGITGLQSIRAVALFGVILLAWAVYYRLQRLTGLVFVSAAAAFALCVMPPFQSVVAMTSSFAMPFAALLGWLGGEAAQAALSRGSYTRRALGLAGGGLLVLAALFIFQPAAMFYWVSLAVGAFAKPQADATARLGRWLTLAGVAAAALVMGFIGFRWAEAAYHFANARGTLTTDFFGKLIWFFKDPLKDSLNYFDLTPSYHMAAVTGIGLAIGMRLSLPHSLGARCVTILAALTLVPLSYLPNLVIAESWSSYRTQLALTGLLVIYGFVALRAGSDWLARCLNCTPATVFVPVIVTLAGLAGFAAFTNLTNTFALPLSLELQYLRRQIREADLLHTSAIWLIQPHYSQSLSTVVRYDEFGMPASSRDWAPEPMIRLVLREIAPGHAEVAVQRYAYDAIVPTPPPGTLIIDMRHLADLRARK